MKEQCMYFPYLCDPESYKRKRSLGLIENKRHLRTGRKKRGESWWPDMTSFPILPARVMEYMTLRPENKGKAKADLSKHYFPIEISQNANIMHNTLWDPSLSQLQYLRNQDLSFFLIFNIFYYVFSSITFPMLSQKSPIPSPHFPTHPFPFFWPWRSPILGHIKFACPMGLSFCVSNGPLFPVMAD